MSNVDPCVEIISMAQQARPNVNGHKEFERPQLKIFEATVTMMPSRCSSTTMGMRSEEASKAGTWCWAPAGEAGMVGAALPGIGCTSAAALIASPRIVCGLLE
jgi:hypothetical protein